MQQKKAIKSQRVGTQSTNPRTRQKLQFNPVPVPVVLKNIQEMKPNKNSFILSRINEDTLQSVEARQHTIEKEQKLTSQNKAKKGKADNNVSLKAWSNARLTPSIEDYIV